MAKKAKAKPRKSKPKHDAPPRPGSIHLIEGPTIAAGESLSDAIDITGYTLVRINAPDNWGAVAPLTFQISTDGEKWFDVYERNGAELSATFRPAASVLFDYNLMLSICWLKVRSGNRESPVVQPEAATFSLVVRKV